MNGNYVTGDNNQVGGSGNNNTTIFNPVHGASSDGPDKATARRGSGAEHVLYAFADIVGYSQLNAPLQKLSQNYLATVLDDSMAEAGVAPELVDGQEQGDALLLTFPAGSDVGRVLATMPRYLNDELLDRNQDMAPHARVRLRLAFAFGASMPGRTGQVGQAPIAAARMANWGPFRHAMQVGAQAQCGAIIDDHLYAEYVRQRFRPDTSPGDYVQARVRFNDKGFDAPAWVRLLGYSGRKTAALLGLP
jgi:class 3 adenylate cyclase